MSIRIITFIFYYSIAISYEFPNIWHLCAITIKCIWFRNWNLLSILNYCWLRESLSLYTLFIKSHHLIGTYLLLHHLKWITSKHLIHVHHSKPESKSDDFHIHIIPKHPESAHHLHLAHHLHHMWRTAHHPAHHLNLMRIYILRNYLSILLVSRS